MNAMRDKLDINLRIGETKLSLTINPADEEFLRDVTKEVNKVYKTYKSRFAGSTPEEVLAKVTLLFARGYLSMSAQAKEVENALDTFDTQLDALLERMS
ncbi:MAG: cell division protein ZapA [Muribaculaceae bacterium]|nr:cell division protein ZapA [Muribaculaceae bacterium]